MRNDKIDAIVELLQTQNENIIASECLQQIQNSKVVHTSSVLLESPHAYRTYKDRYEIQKDVTHSEIVTGYEKLLPKLERIEENELIVQVLVTTIGTYLVFTDVLSSKFIGILKSLKNSIGNIK